MSAAHPAYLAGLDLAGRTVVVVGAGSVAQRRLPALLACGARVTVVSPAARPAIEAMADEGRLTWIRRGYTAGDLAGAWYVLAAADDRSVNAAVSAEAEQQRTFCVRADDGAAGSAVTPAAATVDGVSIGVLGAGDHRRSAAVRDGLAAALRGEGAALDPGPAPAGVALVGGGPGDPELITVRGRRLLARADVVITDRLGPTDLLGQLAADVEVIDASKIPYGRSMAQEKINELLIDRARAGAFVVRLKGGDPYLFGRGYEELQALTEAQVPVTVVPGVPSALSVPAAADIPVTHRGVTHELTIVSGHLAPDHPDSLVDWPALAAMNGTLVIMMGVAKLAAFTEALIAGGRDPQTPAAMISDGTTDRQRTVRADLAGLAAAAAEAGMAPPAITVIGPVAGLTPQG